MLARTEYGSRDRSRGLAILAGFVVGVALASAVFGPDRLAAGGRDAALVGACLLLSALFALALRLRRTAARRRRAEHATIRAEEAARASDRRLGIYVDQFPDGFMTVRAEPDGTFVYERINAAAAEMLGLADRVAIGRQPKEVWPPERAERVEAHLRKCLEATEPLQFDAFIHTASGERVLRFVLAAIRDFPDPIAGPVTLVLHSIRDVTANVALEAQLRQSQRLEAVGQLTAGIAHNFNNLLQVQIGALNLLLKEVAELPSAREHARIVLAACESGAKLTQSLLSFSRKQHLAPRGVALERLLADVGRILSHTLGPRIELGIFAEKGLAAFVDAGQLEAAIVNLALNGRDAMPDGGRLLIEARAVRSGESGPNGFLADQAVILSVTDSGLGMAPEVAAKACEPFFTTKEVGRGSGLGLPMVRGFTEQSGGVMRIVTSPGEGTRVELWLPRAADELDNDVPRAAPSRLRHAGRVLLVDDMADVLAVTAEALEAFGYEVVQAGSGEEALDLLETERAFDILVTDLAMPGIDGAELVRRALAACPGLPAIVSTGYAEVDIAAELPGVVTALRKPFRVEDLAGLIAHSLAATPTDQAA